MIFFKVLVIIGSGTAVIGDPSGKTTAREPIQREQIAENTKKLRAQLESLFTNAKLYFSNEPQSVQAFEFYDNATWYNELNVLDFFEKTGSAVNIGTLLRKRFVRERSQLLSLSEFCYQVGCNLLRKYNSLKCILRVQVFQGLDWLRLWREKDCRLQVGGSDQLANFEAGRHLIHREQPDQQVTGLCLPLITDPNGRKLGKTEQNVLWLSADKTNPFLLYQHFLRTVDDALATSNVFSSRFLNEPLRKRQHRYVT